MFSGIVEEAAGSSLQSDKGKPSSDDEVLIRE